MPPPPPLKLERPIIMPPWLKIESHNERLYGARLAPEVMRYRTSALPLDSLPDFRV